MRAVVSIQHYVVSIQQNLITLQSGQLSIDIRKDFSYNNIIVSETDSIIISDYLLIISIIESLYYVKRKSFIISIRITISGT